MRRRLDQVVIGGLVVLLGLTALLWWVEQIMPPPVMPAQNAPPIPTGTPENWGPFVKAFEHPQDVRQAPIVRTLVDMPMFDPPNEQLLASRRASVEQLYGNAERAFQAGNLAQAKEITRKIIELEPYHQKTIALVKQLEEKTAAQRSQPTPAVGPPGTTAPAATP